MSYVDGWVVAVPTAKKQEYLKTAQEFAGMLKDCGALSVVECWGDQVPSGKLTSFPLAVQCKEDETVVFSWAAWPSREVRDAGHKKFEEDLIAKGDEMTPPFDGKRMIFGSFEVLLKV